MFKYATMQTAAELRERQRRALGRLADLEAERSTLSGRVSEAAATAARRRVEAAKSDTGEEFEAATDSEMSALLRRERELPHEIHSLRVAAAELEIETLEAGMRERREAYDELAPAVETARIGYEESKSYYEQVKRERDYFAPSGMQDYDLRRAAEALEQVQAEAPRG